MRCDYFHVIADAIQARTFYFTHPGLTPSTPFLAEISIARCSLGKKLKLYLIGIG